MVAATSLLPPLSALLFAPLLVGVINRTKAFIAGRRGPPLLQPYRDILKCLRRGAVYGHATSWVFGAGPIINLACLVASVFVMRLGGIGAPRSVAGDMM